MEEEQLIEKIRKLLEEDEQLDMESCYFLTKKLNEQYWEDIQDSDIVDEIEEEPEEEDVDEEMAGIEKEEL